MSDKYIIISASRMTDMPAFYPEALIYEVNKRIQKGFKVHSLVLWTKHISSLFQQPLYSYLELLKSNDVQLYVHLTITGMAMETDISKDSDLSFDLEPNVPSINNTIRYIPELIELTESPDRIRVRIDPLVRLQDNRGHFYSNYSSFNQIIDTTIPFGLKNYTFSFLENQIHRKVDNRFNKKGLAIISPTMEEREKWHDQIRNLEKELNISISACCVPGLKESRCIDGYLLEKLHHHQIPISKKEPRSRLLCGCTESVDIGGWPPKICPSGCLYCYSRPLIGELKS